MCADVLSSREQGRQAEWLTRLGENLVSAGQQRPGALVTNIMNGGRHTVVGGPTMALAKPSASVQAAISPKVDPE